MVFNTGNDASSKTEEFRTALRMHAQENSSDIQSALLKLFDGDLKALSGAGRHISKVVFSELFNGVRSIRQKFTPNDLNDIYSEALLEFGAEGTNVTNLVEHFSLTISRARGMAAQLRKVITEEYPDGVADYERAFDSISSGGLNHVDLDSLTDFAEDMLDMDEGSITDKDAKELYAFIDQNGDGVVDRGDFVEYVLGQSAEAVRRLGEGNDDVIVDLQTSSSVAQEVSFKRAGYVQLVPDFASLPAAALAAHGTFGNGQSLWMWKHKQGTCDGRLKAVTDIRLEQTSMSSDLVLLGYTCLATSIAGQWIWIKRAMTTEQAKDGIMDLHVTLGRSKNASDKIWASPGVGWNHVEGNLNKSMFGLAGGDAFLWFRPMRNRAKNMDQHLGAINAESRQARLLQAIRTAIRHYVPLSIMPGDAQKKGSNTSPRANDVHGQSNTALFDFSHLFGMYAGDSSILSLKNWRRILSDVGARVDKPDEKKSYNHMDSDGNGSLHRKEYAAFLVFTEFEIDCTIDDIRHRLLRQHVTATKPNPLRQSRVLSHIFKHFNTTADKVLSQAELRVMCASLEIFLVGEEVALIMKIMDLDSDGRVEEGDFLRFLKMDSLAATRKAHRVHHAASLFRRWLVRGSLEQYSAAIGSAIEAQWAELKKQCEKVSGTKFPGYLSAQDLQNVLAHQGTHLSFVEASELALVVAPHRNARIQIGDLESFMKGSCRSIGELIAIVERDTMKVIIDLYRAHRNVVNTDGVSDEILNRKYMDASEDMCSRIMASQNNNDEQHWADGKLGNGKSSEGNAANRGSSAPAVVSIAQLKAGIEASMGRPPNSPLPTLEEWSVLAVLVGAACAEDDIFGVNAKKFIEGICVYSAGNLGSIANNEAVTLDALCSQLRAMIKDEALHSGKGKHYDYVSVFHTFDTDGGGSISLQEFSQALQRFQLIDRLPKNQIPALLKVFDTSHSGSISFEDFLRFVESAREDEDDDIALDDDDEGDALLLGLGSNTPPTAITRNADCDWLLWFLWRQACRVSHRDPEALVTDLEINCKAISRDGSDMSREGDYKGLSSETLWRQIGEHRLQGNMTRAQFESGVQFVCLDGRGRNDDPVDFLSLCRYVIRMGRAYNGMVQERRNVDGRKFQSSFASLQKQLIQMDASRQVDHGIGATAGGNSSYFERILRRQDSNQDGLLTVPEFKLGLRRMQIRDERQWTKPMVRKLFEETDNRADGLLSISEFGRVVRGDYSRDAEIRNENLSDDDDDRIFTAQRHMPDSTLQHKVGSILMDLVPLSGQNGSPNAIATHCDAVRTAIYRFFQRFDLQSNGLIAEEQFHVFARKSGLQSRLRGGELRRLVGKLRVRGAGRESAVIDYEKLCRMISPNADSVPRARADAIMLRLQEAARASAMADRSFMNLCTLADPRMTGYVSTDELLIVAKMMGCMLTMPELQMVQDLQNDVGGSVEKQRGPPSSKAAIDYRKFNHLLMTYTPGATMSLTAYSESKEEYRVNARTGALPAYATNSGVTRVPPSPNATISLDHMRGVQNSGGHYMSTPVQVSVDRMSSTGPLLSYGSSVRLGPSVGRSGTYTGGGFENAGNRSVTALASRIEESGLGRGGSAISSFQLRCEEADGSHCGFLSEVALQSLCDDCRVLLTPADLYAVRRQFESPNGDGRIDYIGLCQALRTHEGRSNVRGRTGGFGDILQSPAISRRLRMIRSEGTDVRRMFEEADLDGSGTADSHRFQDIVMRLGMVQTERQLTLALEEFATLGNRNRINYHEFCDAIESAEHTRRSVDGDGLRSSKDTPLMERGGGVGSSRQTVFGSGYDGLLCRSQERGNRTPGSSTWGGTEDYDRPLSDRTELDSLTSTGTASGVKFARGGTNIGLNVARTSPRPGASVGTWRCIVCANSDNQIGALQCSVCDTPKTTVQADDSRICSNCNYANRKDSRSCQLCDLVL